MTSPFDWKSKPSEVAPKLTNRRHVRNQPVRPVRPPVPDLEPKRYHMYSKAGTK